MTLDLDQKITSKDIVAALSRHYIGADGLGEEHVLIAEARRGAGFTGNSNRCDLLAVGTWESRGLQLVGHEIKVSRADWVKELKQPDKAEWIWKHCHQWYLTVSSPHSKIVHAGELPATWGLIEIDPAGRVKIIERAPVNREPAPVAWTMVVGWLAQLDRGGKRDVSKLLAAARSEGEKYGRQRAESEQAGSRAIEEARQVLAAAAAFKQATGIDMRGVHSEWRRDEIARLVKLTDFNGISSILDHVERLAHEGKAIQTNAERILTEHADLRRGRT